MKTSICYNTWLNNMKTCKLHIHVFREDFVIIFCHKIIQIHEKIGIATKFKLESIHTKLSSYFRQVENVKILSDMQ